MNGDLPPPTVPLADANLEGHFFCLLNPAGKKKTATLDDGLKLHG